MGTARKDWVDPRETKKRTGQAHSPQGQMVKERNVAGRRGGKNRTSRILVGRIQHLVFNMSPGRKEETVGGSAAQRTVFQKFSITTAYHEPSEGVGYKRVKRGKERKGRLHNIWGVSCASGIGVENARSKRGNSRRSPRSSEKPYRVQKSSETVPMSGVGGGEKEGRGTEGNLQVRVS